jgi:hypothetical protein
MAVANIQSAYGASNQPAYSKSRPMTSKMHSLLTELILAMQEQTAAINRLADSNMMLVSSLLDEDDDDEAMPHTFLDGSKCQ